MRGPCRLSRQPACELAGFPSQVEVELSGDARIDLVVFFPGETMLVDVTVCSSKAKSYTIFVLVLFFGDPSNKKRFGKD